MNQLMQDPRLNRDEGPLKDNQINFEGLLDEQLNEQDPDQQIRRILHENTQGVRAGGFRPSSYSDNHQEIAQKSLTKDMEMDMNMVLNAENDHFFNNMRDHDQQMAM